MDHPHEEHEVPPSFWSTRYAIGLVVIGASLLPKVNRFPKIGPTTETLTPEFAKSFLSC